METREEEVKSKKGEAWESRREAFNYIKEEYFDVVANILDRLIQREQEKKNTNNPVAEVLHSKKEEEYNNASKEITEFRDLFRSKDNSQEATNNAFAKWEYINWHENNFLETFAAFLENRALLEKRRENLNELSNSQERFNDLIEKQVNLLEFFRTKDRKEVIEEYREIGLLAESQIQNNHNLQDAYNRLLLLNSAINENQGITGQMIEAQISDLEDTTNEIQERISKLTMYEELRDFYLNNTELQHHVEKQEKLHQELDFSSLTGEDNENIKQKYHDQMNIYHNFIVDHNEFFQISGR